MTDQLVMVAIGWSQTQVQAACDMLKERDVLFECADVNGHSGFK